MIKIEDIKNLRFNGMIKLYCEKKLGDYDINIFCLLKPEDYKELKKGFLKDIEFVFWSTSQKGRDVLFEDIKKAIERQQAT